MLWVDPNAAETVDRKCIVLKPIHRYSFSALYIDYKWVKAHNDCASIQYTHYWQFIKHKNKYHSSRRVNKWSLIEFNQCSILETSGCPELIYTTIYHREVGLIDLELKILFEKEDNLKG